MSGFDLALHDCIEALREGRLDVDACLSRYPQHAEALRPLLLTAAALGDAYAETPREEFARDARERFLIASGQRISEAFEVEPSPSFFAAARVKFLMAAQRMRREAAPRRRWSIPSFHAPARALAGAGLALVAFVGFSGYTVASANDALPGDWQYGIKLQTERVRLALAFSDGARRDIELDRASERIDEIEELAARGRIIGPGVLNRLADQTEPLVQAAEHGELDEGEIARLKDVAAKQTEVLAAAAPRVAPEAKPHLAAAREVSGAGVRQATIALAAVQRDTPQVIAASETLAVPSPTDTATAEPTATPEASETPSDATPPAAGPTAIRGGELVVDPTPVDTVNGISWIRLAVGRFTTLIPSEADGWRIAGVSVADGPVAAPTLIHLSNSDGTSLLTLNPRSGDMYWFVLVNGVFDEVQMRVTRDGETLVADPELVRRLYGARADIALFVLDNIEIAPEPTPTPSATPTEQPIVP